MTFAYTHTDHDRRIPVAVIAGESIAIKPKFFQVRVRVGREWVVCCARLLDAWDTADGVEMWQLDLLGPVHGRMSAPARNVRQCQLVDGRCTCAPIDVPEQRACGGAPLCGDTAGARSAPDGNHGVNDL